MSRIFLFITILVCTNGTVRSQKKWVSECTIIYTGLSDGDVSTKTPQYNKDSTVKTIYLKDNNSRIDVVEGSFLQSIIYNTKTAEATVLRTIKGEQYVMYFTPAKWAEQNKGLEQVSFTPTNETKKILGFDCIKGELQLQNKASYTVYYTQAFMPVSNATEWQFKDVPGFVLAYEGRSVDKKNIKYTATAIHFDPIPLSTFILPPGRSYRIVPPQ